MTDHPRPGHLNLLLLALSLFVVGFAASYQPIHDMDLPLHVAAGRHILEHGAVPKLDPFSYTVPGTRWIDHEWLSQVVFALVDRWAGLEGLKILGAVLVGVGLAVWSIAFTAGGVGLLTGATLGLLTLVLYRHHVHVRPHQFSFVATALFYACLVRPPRHRVLVTLVLVGFLLWVQLHGGWVIVPLAFLTSLPFAALQHKAPGAVRAALFTLLFLFMSVFNPEGPVNLATLFAVRGVADLIPEWKSVFLQDDSYGVQKLLVSLLAPFAVIGLWYGRRRVTARLSGLATVAVVMSVGSARFLYLLASALHPVAARLRIATLSPALRIGGVCLIGLVAALGLGDRMSRLRDLPDGAGTDLWPRRFPEEAAARLDGAGFSGTVLCPPTWSGYLLWRLPGRVRVAIDGRVEIYGREIATAMLQLRGDKGVGVVERWPADVLLLEQGVPLAAGEIPGYRVAWRDGVAALFVRDESRLEPLRGRLINGR